MPGPSSLTIRTFQTADAEPLAALLRNSLAAGEHAGRTAGEFDGLIDAFSIARNFLVAECAGRPIGLICSDYKLIVVHPDVRRQGVGAALVATMETVLDSSPDGPLFLYPPHGNHGAIAFLQAVGFAYDHSFWRFALNPDRSIPLPPLPDDLTLSAYTDADLSSYIDLVNTSFADHPTPLRVTQEQVQHRHARSEFDPGSIAILRDSTGRMIGFCTTGVHGEVEPPVGHINLVGVLREQRGRGLGRWLLLWGIERLRSRGLRDIELNVDANNENAIGLYRSVGFDPVEEWPQWVRKPSA